MRDEITRSESDASGSRAGPAGRPGAKEVACFIVAALPAVYFLWTVYRYAWSVPYGDDFCVIMGFMNSFYNSSDVWGKIGSIFKQCAYYRVVFTRLVVLADVAVWGSIHFKHLALFGSLGVAAIVVVLYRCFYPPGYKLLIFVPVSYVLFQPQYWDSIYWATSVLQQVDVFAIAFCSLFFLAKPSRLHFVLSIALAICATYTHGNGMAVFVVGCLVLIHQRRFKDFGIWSVWMALSIAVYFYEYHVPPTGKLGNVLEFSPPIVVVKFLIAFLGAAFGDYSFVAAGLLLIVAVLVVKGRYKKNITLYSFMAFLLLTALMAALLRSKSGVGEAYSIRYMMSSALFIILAYLMVMESLKPKVGIILFPAVLVLSVLFNIYSYERNLPIMKEFRKALMIKTFLWKYTNLSSLPSPRPEMADRMMREALSRGYYRMPEFDEEVISWLDPSWKPFRDKPHRDGRL
jgi:hypothetical protein